MIWDGDKDVKEYRPRKRGARQTPNPINIDGYPIAAPDTADNREEDDCAGGINMPTSEILDFSEGTDSY